MKNIIFSWRNLDFNFVNLELFSAISELPGSFRTRLHIIQKTQVLPIVVLNPAQPVRQLRLESLQRGVVGDDRKDGAKQISTKIMVLY